MKTFIFSALFLSFLSISSLANADYFQIVDGSDGSDIQYAQVYVDGRSYGYTDRYGRIEVDRPNGIYAGKVVVRDDHKKPEVKKLEFNIDGDPALKKIIAQ